MSAVRTCARACVRAAAAYKDTQNGSDALDILVNAFNITPHSSTRISPNNITEEIETQARMNMLRRALTKKYEDLEVGDKVRVPIIPT